MWKEKFLCFLLVTLIAMLSGCSDHSSGDKTKQPLGKGILLFREKGHYTLFKNPSDTIKEVKVTNKIRVLLDSMSEVKLLDSLLDGDQVLSVDGIARFRIDSTARPVRIYTGMMVLTTSKVDFHIKAFHSAHGQSLKVYGGQLIASKSYQSKFPNTDTLQRGDMILINRDIDLMEKETFDQQYP